MCEVRRLVILSIWHRY